LQVKLEIRRLSAAYNWSLYILTMAALAAAAQAALAAAAQAAFAQPAPPAPQARFIVVLDAAHGGDDTGGHLANNQLEKSFTLALSVRLRSLLAARGIQVVTTRDTDATVDPNKRAEIANRAQAQACLSLHTTESGSGVYLFASSLAPAAPARFAAWKTAQAAWVTRSLKLEGLLNSALLNAGMSVTMSRTSVTAMDSMTCPAVAVEIAPEENAGHQTTAELNDKNYQARVAAALAAALLEWRTEARQP
jgi:N-acetylmuramoyl-L-alanine amidase